MNTIALSLDIYNSENKLKSPEICAKNNSNAET